MKAWCSVVAIVMLACGGGPARASEHPGSACVMQTIQTSQGALRGELCVPQGVAPRTVQLLVHGATYTRTYFDWPQQPDRYSYAARALKAGYATFAVDRLGAGESAHPASVQVNITSGAQALSEVVSALRTRFSRVVWVGHSFGSIYAWSEALTHADVDAFVITGMLHHNTSGFLTNAFTGVAPAMFDPSYGGPAPDAGYLTTLPGKRGTLFYDTATADPAVIARDEQTKSTMTGTELATGAPLTADLPSSLGIAVPVLIVVGDHDNISCTGPDAANCSTADAVLARERPFYRPGLPLDAYVAPRTGHNLQLHPSAPQTSAAMLAWVKSKSAP